MNTDDVCGFDHGATPDSSYNVGIRVAGLVTGKIVQPPAPPNVFIVVICNIQTAATNKEKNGFNYGLKT